MAGRDADVPEVKLDGRRAYYGRPQLSDAEIALLRRIQRDGHLQLVFTHAGPWYLCAGRRVDRRMARRLIEHRYVLPDSRGLFDDALAQTWRARPDVLADLTERLKAQLASS